MNEIDNEVFNEVYKEFPSDLKMELLEMANEELTNNIAELNKEIENQDFEEITKISFQIKNNAYSVYANEVGRIGHKIFWQKDRLTKEEIIQLSKELIMRVKLVLEDIKEFMKIINVSNIP
jgi:hypothetical protein